MIYRELVLRYRADVEDGLTGFDKLNSRADQVTRSIDGRFTMLASRMRGFGLAMSAGLTAPLVLAGKTALTAAMNAVESENKFEVAFKGMSAQARQWSEDFAGALGLNSYRLRDMAAQFQLLFNGMGIVQREGTKMSTMLTQLTYDLASLYNVPIEEAFIRLQSGMVGETEAVRRFGADVSDASMQAAALAMGIKKKVQEMSQSEKVMLRYRLILNQTRDAQGDLRNTADQAANQVRLFGERVQMLSIKFGQSLIPELQRALTFGNRVVDWFGRLDEAGRRNVLTIGAVTASLGPLAMGLAALPSLLAGVRIAVAALGGPLGVLATVAIGGLVLAMKQLDQYTKLSTESLNNQARAAERAAISNKKYADSLVGLSKQELETKLSAADRILREKQQALMEIRGQAGLTQDPSVAVSTAGLPKAMADALRKAEREYQQVKKNRDAIAKKLKDMALPAAGGLTAPGEGAGKPAAKKETKAVHDWALDQQLANLEAAAIARKLKQTDPWMKQVIDVELEYAKAIAQANAKRKEKGNSEQAIIAELQLAAKRREEGLAAIRADREKAHAQKVAEESGQPDALLARIESVKEQYNARIRTVEQEIAQSREKLVAPLKALMTGQLPDVPGILTVGKSADEIQAIQVGILQGQLNRANAELKFYQDKKRRLEAERDAEVARLRKKLNENPEYRAKQDAMWSDQMAGYERAALLAEERGETVTAAMLRAFASYRNQIREIEETESATGVKLTNRREVAWAEYQKTVREANEAEVAAEAENTRRIRDLIVQRIQGWRSEAQQRIESVREANRAALESLRSAVGWTSAEDVWRKAMAAGTRERFRGEIVYQTTPDLRANYTDEEIQAAIRSLKDETNIQNGILAAVERNTRGLRLNYIGAQ